MDISLFLAQVFGLYFILAGITVLLRPAATVELIQTFTNRNVTFISGFVVLMVGVPLVLLHTVWDGSWRVLVTVLVWAILIKGLARIFAPDLVVSGVDLLLAYPRIVRHMVWVFILLGLYLLYLGFEWG